MFSKNSDSKINERLENLKPKVLDYQTPAAEKPLKTHRTETEWRSYVDEQIANSMKAGHFDNLPGKGKPLQLRKNPYADPGEDLAMGILKDSGFAPEWIERDKEIRKEIEAARANLNLAWQRYQNGLASEKAWEGAIVRFNQALYQINAKIKNYNLIVPILSKQRMSLQLATEIKRVQNAK